MVMFKDANPTNMIYATKYGYLLYCMMGGVQSTKKLKSLLYISPFRFSFVFEMSLCSLDVKRNRY